MNFKIDNDEIILFEGHAGYKENKSNSVSTRFTLTSKRMIFEKEIGFFKTHYELYKEIFLSDIKIFNDEVNANNKQKVFLFKLKMKIYHFLLVEYLMLEKYVQVL